MYCGTCGTKLMGDEKYCFHCGNPINTNTIIKDNNSKKTSSIVLGIISIVGVFFVILSPITLILSFIGLIIGIKANKETKDTTGIILNATGLFLSLIITLIIAVLVIITINVSKNVDWQINDDFINDLSQSF